MECCYGLLVWWTLVSIVHVAWCVVRGGVVELSRGLYCMHDTLGASVCVCVCVHV